MKRTFIYLATALAATLSLAGLSGCGSQPASSDTETLPEPAEVVTEVVSDQSQDEILVELKDAIANEPAYQSVTVVEKVKAVYTGEGATDEGEADSDSVDTVTTYKFDASGDELRTYMLGEMGDIKIQYYSEGDNAVCITDGPVYSGTVAQFDMTHFGGVDAYVEGQFGDLSTLIECVDTVSKARQGDLTLYTLDLNPQKYIESDETLVMLAEYDSPVTKAVMTIGFDQNGYITLMSSSVSYPTTISNWKATLSDFDATTIDPMPKADRDYDEMQADIGKKLEAFERGLGLDDEVEAEASEDAATK